MEDDRPIEDKPHKAGWLRCRMCGDRFVAVWPVSIVDEERQECGSCGHMTCGPEEEEEEGP